MFLNDLTMAKMANKLSNCQKTSLNIEYVYIKMSKNLSFIIHYDHTIDNYRLVPVANFYYSLNFGIQLKW